MKPLTQKHIALSLTLSILVLSAAGCGKQATATGSVNIQSWQLGGSSSASFGSKNLFLAMADGALSGLTSSLLGIKNAFAAVSSFSTFKACNDTLKFLDSNGNQLTINGNANPSVGRGLLTFSSSSSLPMPIGALDIPAGTSIKEIDMTFAVVPSVCSGASYAVQFDNGIGGGTISVTQNTAFKFVYTTPITIAGGETLNLLFGNIVNAMVSAGSGLNNSSIQSINVGQAN